MRNAVVPNGKRTGVGSSKPSSGTFRLSEPRRAVGYGDVERVFCGKTATGAGFNELCFSCIGEGDAPEDEDEGEQGMGLYLKLSRDRQHSILRSNTTSSGG